MSIEIHIIDGAIPHTPGMSESGGGASESHGHTQPHDTLSRHAAYPGAIVTFDGIVRPTEEGRPLAALSYEHYEPMASEQLRALAEDILQKHALIALQCLHSRGRVNIGECSMRVIVCSAHRKEALAAMGEFIDRLKKDVPIWKSVIWT